MDTKKISAKIREIADLLIADEAVESEQPKVDKVDDIEKIEIEPEVEEKEKDVIAEVAKNDDSDFNKRLAEAMKILKGGR